MGIRSVAEPAIHLHPSGGDDTAAFQSLVTLIAGLTEANRPRIQLMAGTYNVGTLTGIPKGLRIEGSGMTATKILYTGSGKMFETGTFTTSPASYYSGTSQGMYVSNCWIEASSGFGTPGSRAPSCFWDNGSGGIHLARVRLRYFKYGVCGAYGSDFDYFDECDIQYCDVGIYAGPGSQQMNLHKCMITNCQEGLVIDGSPEGVVDHCSFIDNSVTDVTFDANQPTRLGVTVEGSAHELRWRLVNCWFESNADGTNTWLVPQHVLLQGTAGAGLPRYVHIINPYLVSGGTVSSTASFVNVQAGTRVQIENLLVRGDRIKYCVNVAASLFPSVVQRNTRIADGFTNPQLWGNEQAGCIAVDDYLKSFRVYTNAFHEMEDTSTGTKYRLVAKNDNTFAFSFFTGGSWIERYVFDFNNTAFSVGGFKVKWSNVAPTSGTWTRGDVVWNSQAAVGQPNGWRCTVSGTPGTWVAMGNL